MKDMVNNGLEQKMSSDRLYQQLLQDCFDAESDYLQLLDTLSAEHRLVIERYLTACEELDHRQLTLATE